MSNTIILYDCFVAINIRWTMWRWKRCLPGFFEESTSDGVCAGISAFRGICFIPTLGSLHMHHRSSSAFCLCGWNVAVRPLQSSGLCGMFYSFSTTLAYNVVKPVCSSQFINPRNTEKHRILFFLSVLIFISIKPGQWSWPVVLDWIITHITSLNPETLLTPVNLVAKLSCARAAEDNG